MQCDEAYLNSALDAAATRTYRMAARFGLPTADREDIQQELMLDMLERADQFDPAKGSAGTFISCSRAPRATLWPICRCPTRRIVARGGQSSMEKKFASKTSPKTTRPSLAPPVPSMASAMSSCATVFWI